MDRFDLAEVIALVIKKQHADEFKGMKVEIDESDSSITVQCGKKRFLVEIKEV